MSDSRAVTTMSDSRKATQNQKFIDKARELGCDETTSTVFERAFSEIVLPKRRIKSQVSKQSKTKKPDQ